MRRKQEEGEEKRREEREEKISEGKNKRKKWETKFKHGNF
jgi:hypothetical protein